MRRSMRIADRVWRFFGTPPGLRPSRVVIFQCFFRGSHGSHPKGMSCVHLKGLCSAVIARTLDGGVWGSTLGVPTYES